MNQDIISLCFWLNDNKRFWFKIKFGVVWMNLNMIWKWRFDRRVVEMPHVTLYKRGRCHIWVRGCKSRRECLSAAEMSDCISGSCIGFRLQSFQRKCKKTDVSFQCCSHGCVNSTSKKNNKYFIFYFGGSGYHQICCQRFLKYHPMLLTEW